MTEDKSFNDFIRETFTVIKNGIKVSNILPSTEDFNYYMCFGIYNKIQNEQVIKLMNFMQYIVERTGVAGNIKQRDIEEKFDLILESNDIFLDRAGICMDLESGVYRNPSVELILMHTHVQNRDRKRINTTSLHNKQVFSMNSVNSVKLLAGKNIQRPQLIFKDKIDNSQKPWSPKIKHKPNSLKPLHLVMEYKEHQEVVCHPYEYELDKFEPFENQLIKKPPIKYKDLNETAFLMIQKVEDLQILMKDLENQTEIAVDLEHHSYRSFQGITCLMQISTRDTDYLIDTLVLRSQLYILNEIFTKPSILKVFHGADLDILWLQRDLSLYVVNMFDTHQAAKLLELPFLSLSYLLRTYCKIDVSKHFQLADWRIRPLPEELINYAREDTHYLLYIKDILNNNLIDSFNGQSNLLKALYLRSNDICKNIYKKPIWTEDSYLSMYRKSKKMFNNRQLYALKELHKWRDETARIEDDSISYVLPNHMLLNIAETLPREMQGVLACCNPIPPLIRQNLLKIHKMILKAREQSIIKPVLEDDIKQRLTQRNLVLRSKSWIFAPHDIPCGMEVRANLSCLLSNSRNELSPINQTKYKSTISVFDSSSEDESMDLETDKIRKKMKLIFVSPFERYKRVLTMIIEEAKEKIDGQGKSEREKNLKQSQGDTNASISRVHDHFMKTVQSAIDNAYPNSSVNSAFTTNHIHQIYNRNKVRGTKDKLIDLTTDAFIGSQSFSVDTNLSQKLMNNQNNVRVHKVRQIFNKKRKRNLSLDLIQTCGSTNIQQSQSRKDKNKRKR